MKLNLVLDNVVLQSTGVEAIYDDITTTITSTITETSTLYHEAIPTLLKRAPTISRITSIPISTSTSSNDNSKSSGKAVAIAVPIIAIMMIIIAIIIVWNVRRRRGYDSENDDDEMYVSSEEDEKDKEKEKEVKDNTYNTTKINIIPPSTATSFASVSNTIPWNKSVRDTSPFITLPSERDIAMLKTNK
ncbi:hypothetical protein DAPK24_021820 [Pichia kluyveri]|uniref:Mid2 domain-containing protein n=1 Tax=Pichia kluyveri TaxID=36015 RepID=A0AAV5R3P3_PICKL|nr:hypothetical protein DAPK24_021820 [Pichia kluyveri]